MVEKNIDRQTFSRLLEENELLRKALSESASGRELIRQQDEFSLLVDVSKAIVSELDLQKVFALVAVMAQEIIQAELLLVPMISQSRDFYTYMAAAGKGAEDARGMILKIHVGMCGWVLQHRRPLLFGESNEWWMDEKTRWEEGQQSALLVPLFGRRRQIIGGLSGIGKVGGGSFTTHDLDLLTMFANQVSVAIENARLFQEWQHTIEELQQKIKERDQATLALQDREKRFRTLIDQATDAIFVSDLSGQLIDVNRQACTSLGYTQEELLRLNVSDLDPTFVADQHQQDLWEKLAPNTPVTVESRHVRKDGSVFPVEINIGRLEIDGRPAILGLARDITDRKKTEAILLKSKEEWEKTFDAMPDIVTLQDKDLRIVRANKAAYAFLRKGPDELPGEHCYTFFRGSAEPCPGCPVLAALQDKYWHSEIIHHEKLGKVFHVSSAPIFDQNNELQYLVHVAKDITEKIKLEEELMQAHKMEAIGTLAGGIAHDFNNILTAVLGYAEIAKIESKEGRQPVAELDEVIQAASRARDLVKQILTFSRKTEHKQQPIAPDLLIQESLKLLRASIPATIAITEDIDTECGLILAEPTHVRQIIVNLCINAIQAMEDERGELRIALTRKALTANDIKGAPGVLPGQFVRLTVSDTGVGMAKATMDHIFEPYYTTKGLGKGTGLGLAVVHGLVQQYGGLIQVESQLGQGTTFHLYFPACPGQAEAPRVAADETIPTGSERILLVDDEEAIVTTNTRILAHLGYRVTGRISSVEALAEFQAHPDSFDLVISDQTMPGKTGEELAREILRIRPDIPIILCTGYSSRIDSEKAKALGIRAFAMKPLNRLELARIVRNALD